MVVENYVPISEADMVLQFQMHLAKMGILNSDYTNWKKQPTADRTWKTAKTWFRNPLKYVEAINKLATGEAVLTANAVIKTQHTEEKVRNKIQYQQQCYCTSIF